MVYQSFLSILCYNTIKENTMKDYYESYDEKYRKVTKKLIGGLDEDSRL